MKLTKNPNGLSSATKPNNFSLIPQIYKLKGEKFIFNCVPGLAIQSVFFVLLPKTQVMSFKELKSI